MNEQVYLLEDDESICDLVQCTLDMHSISCRTFTTVKAFSAAVEEHLPDVVLLDIMLADGNGLEVLERLKARFPSLCVIMLSALGKETDKVKGLNAGADDYITKPFGVLELIARVNAALRRIHKTSQLRLGSIVLNNEDMSVIYHGKQLELSNKEYQLLRYFMVNEGKVLPRETILSDVWGYDGGETRTLDNHVMRLRKMGLNIITLHGVGYKFIAD